MQCKRIYSFVFILLLFSNLFAAEKELRGVWFAWAGSDVPSKETIATTMQSLADANFNVVYVDVWRYGYPYFRSEVFHQYTGLYTDPSLNEGRDVLSDMIAEGHRVGLEVDAWFEQGFTPCAVNNLDMFEVKPQWFARKKDGSTDFFSNGGIRYKWFSHCNNEAQQFLIELAMEVARNYDVDGIEFDRVRYPELDCGYDSATVELYKSEHSGQSPPTNIADSGWKRWRADKLTEFVATLYDSIKSVNPAVTVSNAPLPWGYDQFCQDWPPWVNQGNLDIVSTQMYYTSNDLYTWRLDTELNHISDNSKMYPGISTTANGQATPASELVKMVQTTRSRGLKGQVIWYTRNLIENPEYITALKADVFSEKVELPYRPDGYRLPSIIVHETDSTVTRSDNWTTYISVPGFDEKCLYVNGTTDEWITYHTEIPITKKYELYVYVVRHWNGHKQAHYIIKHQQGQDTVYVDQSLEGHARWYRLGEYTFEEGKRQILELSDEGLSGKILFTDAIMLLESKREDDPVSAIVENKVDNIPDSFTLLSNYPNPFNGSTKIRFQISGAGEIRIDIFNTLGQKIDHLQYIAVSGGTHSINWNPQNLSSGVYYYRIGHKTGKLSGKVIYVK